ncbi:hypothetical protein H0E87_021710, partial [Populus deltoides]
MAKALEQEPQVQIFGRDNVKNNPQRLWPIYVFPSIQPPPKEKKANQATPARSSSNYSQISDLKVLPNGCTSFNQLTLIFIFF